MGQDAATGSYSLVCWSSPGRSAATSRQEPPARSLVWELRVGFSLPLHPFAMGALVSGVLILGYVILQAVFGIPLWDAARRGTFSLAPTARDAFVAALALGFVVAAFRHTFITTGRDLRELARHDPAIRRALHEHPTVLVQPGVVRASRRAGLIGVLVGLAVSQLIGQGLLDARRPPPWSPGWLWAQSVFLLLFWVLGRCAYFTLKGARYAADLAPKQVNLLDLDHLRGFGRIGLRLSLAWIVGLSIFSLLTLFEPTSESGATIVLVMAVTLVVAAVALVLPVRGVQRSVHRAKLAQIAAVRAELGRVREAALAGEKSLQGRLADLLAYEARIAGVREWPFDASTLTRFVLYLLIPLGSWLAGALVERLVDAVLD